MQETQENLNLTISTPLGKDALILDKLEGVEQISSPFCFNLFMHSAKPALDLSGLVGKEVQITYKYGNSKRYFCGIVGAAEQSWTAKKEKNNFTFYQAKIFPKFWLLKFTRDHRIFQNKSALDIIKEVLKDNGVTEIEDKTTKCGKRVREYCVQYGESCFNFVSRLLEEEGIFYFFKHTNSTHKMVLMDDSKSAESVDPEKIEYLKAFTNNMWFNYVHTITAQEQVVPKKYAAADFNFETPTTKLYSKVTGEGMGGEVYDYPGFFMNTGDGDKVAGNRIQDLEWAKVTLSGFSTTPLFCPMYQFSMAEHPRASLNKKYILYKVHHRINQEKVEDEELYENEFVAFPQTIPFRPDHVSVKPLIHSTQTAIVTTKSGEEIWCDEYGRIKVKFHWDQRGSNDEKSSCWIRVAQLWAGNNWGGLYTPRIGMEVVVTFLDGDPDRPLITGCVYNGKNANPYAKNEPTKSTIKSDTTKGGGGFNEFRFEDKKDSEEIYTHAQKDQNTVVEHSRTLLIKTGDDTSTITQGDRTVTLKGEKGKDPQRGNDTLILEGKDGSRMVQIKGDGGNHTLEITKGENTIHLKKGNETTTLDSGDQTISITGNRDIKVTKNNTMKVTGNLEIKVDGNISIKSTGNTEIKSTGNMDLIATGNLTMEGTMVKLTAKAGATIDGGPTVLVKGASATLQGSGTAVVTAPAVAIG